MAQFDVYRNKNPKTKSHTPYLLDIQTDFLAQLNTRLIIPLVIPEEINHLLQRLHIPVEVEKKSMIICCTELVGAPISVLGNKIASLKHKREEIIAALDFLVLGF